MTLYYFVLIKIEGRIGHPIVPKFPISLSQGILGFIALAGFGRFRDIMPTLLQKTLYYFVLIKI